MRVTLWGTRGSLPAAGPETVGYGGNTACVEVRGDDGSVLVLDAGTGIRRLGDALGADVTRIDVLLSHLHMDHIQGLGFFEPLYETGREVHIWGPATSEDSLRERLGRYLSPPLFPVRVRDLESHPELHHVEMGAFRVGDLEVRADLVCHPGPTIGYRISQNGHSMAYLSDHEPALGNGTLPKEPEWTSGFDLASGVDLLLHDAQYSDAEYVEHIGWGHSSVEQALAFAKAVGAGRLVTFHHDPTHDDAWIDAYTKRAVEAAEPSFDVIAGAEGASFEV
ncbi:MAG: MBL fold metallo-hydrolase [Dehalococcoidia bacterium]